MRIGMETHQRATIAGAVVPASKQLECIFRMFPSVNQNLGE